VGLLVVVVVVGGLVVVVVGGYVVVVVGGYVVVVVGGYVVVVVPTGVVTAAGSTMFNVTVLVLVFISGVVNAIVAVYVPAKATLFVNKTNYGPDTYKISSDGFGDTVTTEVILLSGKFKVHVPFQEATILLIVGAPPRVKVIVVGKVEKESVPFSLKYIC
jgi:hypothetical protein